MITAFILLALLLGGIALLSMIGPIIKLLVIVAIVVVAWRVINGRPWHGKDLSAPDARLRDADSINTTSHIDSSLEVRPPDQPKY